MAPREPARHTCAYLRRPTPTRLQPLAATARKCLCAHFRSAVDRGGREDANENGTEIDI